MASKPDFEEEVKDIVSKATDAFKDIGGHLGDLQYLRDHLNNAEALREACDAYVRAGGARTLDPDKLDKSLDPEIKDTLTKFYAIPVDAGKSIATKIKSNTNSLDEANELLRTSRSAN